MGTETTHGPIDVRDVTLATTDADRPPQALAPVDRSGRPRNVTQVLDEVDRRLQDGRPIGLRPVATGFGVLDDVLGGGLRPGELTLLAGAPGIGKTITALQWARQFALDGGTAVVVCYEHEPTTLLARLLALEAGELGGDLHLSQLVTRALTTGRAGRTSSLSELLEHTREGAEALQRLRTYADRLVLVRGSGSHTSVDALREIVRDHLDAQGPVVLLVDYLQKIALYPEPELEAEKVTRTVEGVKDLALELSIPVVLLSAVDAEGLRTARVRMHHLRGSSAIAFEADVVVMLNDKARCVSKVHLGYDPIRARTFGEQVVFSVEKNRGGPTLVDVEFRKDLVHYRFDPDGGVVAERLVDERIDESTL